MIHQLSSYEAIVFAVFAVLLAALFALNAVQYYGRSVTEQTTADKRLFLQSAVRFAASSIVLLVPAVWYARVGIRGEPTLDDSPSTP